MRQIKQHGRQIEHSKVQKSLESRPPCLIFALGNRDEASHLNTKTMKKQTINGAPLMATITDEGSVFIHENKRNAKRYFIGVTHETGGEPTVQEDDLNEDMVIFYRGLPITPNEGMFEGATVQQLLNDFNATAQRLDELFSAQSADEVADAVRFDSIEAQPLREWISERFNGGATIDLIADNIGGIKVCRALNIALFDGYRRNGVVPPVFIAVTTRNEIVATPNARTFTASLSRYWHRYDNNAQRLDAVEDFGGFGGFYVATIDRSNAIRIYNIPLNCAI